MKTSKPSLNYWLPPAVFGALTLLVMIPWYRPGYLFLLDMAATPRIDLAVWMRDGVLSPQLPLGAFTKLLSYAFTPDIIQKILLTLVLFLPGITMERLTRRWLAFPWSLASGILFMFNPWVYERLLAGHWLVLLGYGLFPLFAGCLADMVDTPSRKHFFAPALIFALYPLASLHWAYIAAAFSIFFIIIKIFLSPQQGIMGIFRRQGRLSYDKILKGALLAAACALAINAFWLIGFLKPQSTYSRIATEDFAAYQTRSDPQWGIWANALSLYGFWNNEYLLPKDTFSLWPLVTLIILSFSVLGGYKAIKAREPLGTVCALLFIPLLLIGVGYGSSTTKPLVTILASLVPGLKGLRETGKLLGLLSFAYAFLAPLGARWITEKTRQAALLPAHAPTALLACLLMILPLINTHTIFWGFSGQVQPSHYPVSWFEADQILAAEPAVQNTLFLPWHGYLAFPFTRQRRVSNLAPRFFRMPVIASHATDNAFLIARDQDEWDGAIFRLVQGVTQLEDEEAFFRAHAISHIILARGTDHDRYGFLASSPSLTPVFAAEDLTVYRIAFSPRFSTTD